MHRRAFTLIEMLVSVAIIAVLVTISGLAFRRIAESNLLAQSKNAVLTYAKIARGYAVAHHVETMMVVNPFNGRFEIWHANPAPLGGSWDPLSEAPLVDGYAYAPVLDSGARLPTDTRGRPLAAVHPIDYDENPDTRPLAPPDERNMDNMTWAAFCFDKNGELVTRTRRIATRTYRRRDGSLRPAPNAAGGRNRLIDESPDLSVLTNPPGLMVTNVADGSPDGDTAITSTRGFVISDAAKMRQVLGSDVITDPNVLVTEWLLKTRPSQPYADFADTIVLNRFSGHELARKGL